MNKIHFSSKSHEWYTPKPFIEKLNEKYPIVLDVCATPQSAVTEHYYALPGPVPNGFTPPLALNGLIRDWVNDSKNGYWYMNPPYGREITFWIKKAIMSYLLGSKGLLLLPARTDTKWFHDYLYKKPGIDIEFLKGRLKFDSPNGIMDPAPFPSMLVRMD